VCRTVGRKLSREESRVDHALGVDPSQREENHDQLDERAE
jgi:hypothetical protein